MPKRNHFSELKNQEREYRKKFISDVAFRMFTKRPYNQVTMRNIADEIGITPAAIYSYFPDKNELFAEAYAVSGDTLIEEFTELLDGCDDLCAEKIALKYISHFYGSSTGRPFNIIMQFMIDDSISIELWEKINKTNRLFTGLVEDFFQKFNKKTDTKKLAQSFIATLNGILLTSKNYPKKSEEEILQHMKKLASLSAGLFKEQILKDA